VQSFRHSLDRLAGRPLQYFGTYVSTESPLGFEIPGHASDPARMAFLPDHVLYSFTELNGTGAPPLALDELKEGGEYLLNLGTPNGILHYAIHDWIKVARTKPFVQFELPRRKKHPMRSLPAPFACCRKGWICPSPTISYIRQKTMRERPVTHGRLRRRRCRTRRRWPA